MLQIGPGGVLALVAAVWAWVWAATRTPGRPWRSWFPTATAFAAVMLAAPAVTTQSWLLVEYGYASSVLDVAERQEVLDGAYRAYRGLGVGVGSALVLALALSRSRGGWAEGGRASVAGVAAAATMIATTAVSWGTIAVFHVVHLSAGAEAVAPTSVQVGSAVLLTGLAAGWLSLGSAVGWASLRGAAWAWERSRRWREARRAEASEEVRPRRARRRRA